MMDWFINEESGQGMVEYGLILVLISVVAIAALGGIGKKLKANFNAIDKELEKNSGNINENGVVGGVE